MPGRGTAPPPDGRGTDTPLEGRCISIPRPDPIEYARRKARVFSPLPAQPRFRPFRGPRLRSRGAAAAAARAHAPSSASKANQEIMGSAVAHGLPARPRLLIVRTRRTRGAAAALRSLGGGRFRRVIELPLCAGYRLAPELYARIAARASRRRCRATGRTGSP